MKALLLLLLLATTAFASETGLTINTAEFGIGKFHRYDNKQHPYNDANAWKVFVLADDADITKGQVVQTSENAYTIFYTHLEELIQLATKLSKDTGKKIQVLNFNAHGLPGGMWFPKDAQMHDSWECAEWRSAASGDDVDNYNQYYSATSKSEIMSLHDMAKRSSIPAGNCLTGIDEWTEVVGRNPEFKLSFTSDAQVHMLSCLVGSGSLGDRFTSGLANLLFGENLSTQRVETSIKFGLGDWSMPTGMGFWDYESDDQLDRDNKVYPVDRRDDELMQKGDIRVALAGKSGVQSGLIQAQDYVLLSLDTRPVVTTAAPAAIEFFGEESKASEAVRIPGTRAYLK